jgi:hypothetical protein
MSEHQEPPVPEEHPTCFVCDHIHEELLRLNENMPAWETGTHTTAQKIHICPDCITEWQAATLVEHEMQKRHSS